MGFGGRGHRVTLDKNGISSSMSRRFGSSSPNPSSNLDGLLIAGTGFGGFASPADHLELRRRIGRQFLECLCPTPIMMASARKQLARRIAICRESVREVRVGPRTR